MDNKKKADVLCVVSVVCEVIAIPIGFSMSNGLMGIISNGLGALGSLVMIVGIVLLIYIRTKFPEHELSKILLLVYVVCGIVLFVMWIQFRIAYSWINSCYDSCFGCDRHA